MWESIFISKNLFFWKLTEKRQNYNKNLKDNNQFPQEFYNFPVLVFNISKKNFFSV